MPANTPATPPPELAASASADAVAVKRSRAKLFLVILVCAAPVVASYITYYFIKPTTRSNYGDLVDPQRPLPKLSLRHLDGRNFDADELKGKWLMLTVDGGDCAQSCQDKLYQIRQVRLTTGKDRDRVQRVWLIPDDVPLSTMLMREYDGTIMLRANAAELAAWLPALADTKDTDHIYVVDPLGNLMMRFPRNADPSQTKKDISKLLRASAIG